MPDDYDSGNDEYVFDAKNPNGRSRRHVDGSLDYDDSPDGRRRRAAAESEHSERQRREREDSEAAAAQASVAARAAAAAAAATAAAASAVAAQAAAAAAGISSESCEDRTCHRCIACWLSHGLLSQPQWSNAVAKTGRATSTTPGRGGGTTSTLGTPWISAWRNPGLSAGDHVLRYDEILATVRVPQLAFVLDAVCLLVTLGVAATVMSSFS